MKLNKEVDIIKRNIDNNIDNEEIQKSEKE
jgi:hypothetical protein